MKTILALTICSLFSVLCLGQEQNTKIDSLKVIIKKEQNVDSIIKFTNAIAIIQKNTALVDEAIETLHKNIQFSKKNEKETGVGEASLILSQIYIYNKQELDSSAYYASKAIEIFKRAHIDNKLSRAYFLISIVYQSKSDFENQLKFALLALEYAEKAEDYSMISDSSHALNMYFLDQSKLEDALIYAKKSNEYALLSKKSTRISTAYMGLAETYNLLRDTLNANIFFEKAYELTKQNNQRFAIAWTLTNWAKLKNTEEALKMRLEAQEIWEEFGISPMYTHNTGMIGVLFFDLYKNENDALKKNDYLTKAEKYLSATIENADDQNDIVNSIEFNRTLAQLYGVKKQYDKAYIYLEKSTTLNDSLNSQEIKNQLAKLESKKEIELRDKEIEVNQLKLETQKKQQYYLIGGVSLLAIIGGLLYYQSQTRRKNNQKLRLLNQELAQSNKVKTRFFSILNHDLRSPVANLIHFLHLQKNNPEIMDETTRKRLESKTISGAENLLASMEDMLLWSKGQMENFKPEPKSILIEEFFIDNKKVFSGYQDIQFEYHNPDNIKLFTDENYLKTIMRNLTSNAINIMGNIQAPTIIWKAWQENNQKLLSITDNGRGAHQEQFKALYDENEVVGIKSGLGLHLIRDLAKAIDCEVKVNSEVGSGTTFTLLFQ